jgi:pimeloyl-ACP methyl ester carboxylesterase
MEALSDRYGVIARDIRGHGRSDSPDDPAFYSLQHAVADMLVILSSCGVERAAIGRHSLGGLLSLAFHMVHPEREPCHLCYLKRCVLAGGETGPFGRRWEHRRPRRGKTLQRKALRCQRTSWNWKVKKEISLRIRALRRSRIDLIFSPSRAWRVYAMRGKMDDRKCSAKTAAVRPS